MRFSYGSRLALALCVGAVAVAAPRASEAQQKHGDVSADGQVTALDAQAILSAVVGLPLPPTFVLSNGVANCDGRTVPAALDAQIVLSFVIGLNTSQFCVGQTFGPGATTVSVTLGNPPTAVPDTSLLVNGKLQLRAILRNDQGVVIERPVTWSTSNADLVTVDSARGDTAWVSNHFSTTGAADAAATITAHADGTLKAIAIRVFRSYFGIVIQPQRGDTLDQLNGTQSFTARGRDSLGFLTDFPGVTWSTGDPGIATVPPGPTNTGVVTALTTGTTYLYAETSQGSGGLKKDSVPVTVALPPLNTCTGSGGVLHQSKTYTTPQVWSPTTNPHYVNGQVAFASGATLTVQPGTLVCLHAGARLYFQPGSRLSAVGTVDQPIKFTSTFAGQFWSDIQFGDFATIVPEPADTSVIENALFEFGNNGSGTINGRERHAVRLDNVVIRQSNQAALSLTSIGSRLIRSRIDTVLQNSSFFFAAFISRASLEETTIRVGSLSSGLNTNDAGTIRQVTIIGGTTGWAQTCCNDSTRVNDLTIANPVGVALDLRGGLLHPASANIQISGGAGGAFRGQIGNLGILFPDSLKQATLTGQGKDTVFVSGGTLVGVTAVVRPDLPWVVDQQTFIDTLAQLAPRPGAVITFSNGGFVFQRGGTLDARGEPGKIIRFRPPPSASFANFFGLQFGNPGAAANPANNPTAVSTLAFVDVDSASGQSTPSGGICHNSCVAAITAGDRHRVQIDNATIRKSFSGAVYLNTPGSEITNSRIDTTGTIGTSFTSNSAAVALGRKTLMSNTLVRRSGQVGLFASAGAADTTARLQNVRIVASRDVGLDVSSGVVAGDHGGVRVDSANAWSYRGTIQNLAILARDSLTQENFRGNVDDVVIIRGGSLQGTPGVHTPAAPLVLEASVALRWHVDVTTTIDTIAQLRARPGTDFAFVNSSFTFSRGGTLHAVGESGKVIRFRPFLSGNFGGLQFQNPGAAANPVDNPTATSTLAHVRLDSASGVSTPSGGICHNSCVAAINAGDRHRLLIDNARIHKAWSGAVYLNTPQSQITNSLIDTTGTVSTDFTNNTAAVALGERTLMQNTLVHRSGNVGVHTTASPATDTSARLVDVRIVASRQAGLQADQGVLAGDLASVRIDSANAHPFQGTIENFAAIAGDSVSQLRLLGNLNDLAVITGGTLRGTPGVHSVTPRVVEAIPGLRWQVQQSTVTIDTLARLHARAAADFSFINASFVFRAGGTLDARGEAAKIVRFRPVPGSGGNLNGLQFQNVGSTVNPADNLTAVSTLSFVQVDSATGVTTPSGGLCHISCSAAINAANRHRLLIDNARIHKAWSGAVYLNTPGSEITSSQVDTTGNPSTLTTNTAAVALGNGTKMVGTLVHRSGNAGVYTVASPATDTSARLQNVRIVASQGAGLIADQGVLAGDLGSVRIDSANASPYQGIIENFAAIAADSVSQLGLLGNVDDRVLITGGTLRGVSGTHSSQAPRVVEVIPGLSWRVQSSPAIDTLAQMKVRPGSSITFVNGHLSFRNGGTLDARGVRDKAIVFKPDASGSFQGLQFQRVGNTVNPADNLTATSFLSFVSVDSASGATTPTGGVCHNSCAAAINSAHRHQLLIDNVVIRRSWSGALYLGEAGSQVTNTVIDTTGTLSTGYTSNTAAVALDSTTSLSNVMVRRSGHTGIYIQRQPVVMADVEIRSPRAFGVQIASGAPNLRLSDFTVDSAALAGVHLGAGGVQLSNCTVQNGSSHGFQANANHAAIVITTCNIENNGLSDGGRGVEHVSGATNVIDASNNFWGLDAQGLPITPTLNTQNGISAAVTVLTVLTARVIH